MRQQTRHPEYRVKQEDAELGSEIGSKAIGPVQHLGQFLRRFVAKGIANNHEDFAVVRFHQATLDMSLVKLLLIRDLVETPALQEPGGACRIDKRPPAQGEMREI